MPMNRKLYPKNWDEIATARKQAANWTCEWCDRPCRRPGEDDLSLMDRIALSDWAGDLWDGDPIAGAIGSAVLKLGRFTLTVAHINHQPEDCRPKNLAALCSVCHCRYDLKALPLKRRLKAERLGQLTLSLEGES